MLSLLNSAWKVWYIVCPDKDNGFFSNYVSADMQPEEIEKPIKRNLEGKAAKFQMLCLGYR